MVLSFSLEVLSQCFIVKLLTKSILLRVYLITDGFAAYHGNQSRESFASGKRIRFLFFGHFFLKREKETIVNNGALPHFCFTNLSKKKKEKKHALRPPSLPQQCFSFCFAR